MGAVDRCAIQDGSATRRDGERGDNGPDLQGAGWRRRCVPRADRAAPPRATGALLPDARILPGSRGRPARDAARPPGKASKGFVDAPRSAPGFTESPPTRALMRAARPAGDPPRSGMCLKLYHRSNPARRGRMAGVTSRLRLRGCDRRADRPGGPLRADRIDLPGRRDCPSGLAAWPARRPHFAVSNIACFPGSGYRDRFRVDSQLSAVSIRARSSSQRNWCLATSR